MSPEIAEIQQRWSQMSEAEFARLKKGDLRQDVQPYFDLELERRRNLGENTESCLASDAAVSAPDGEVSRDASEPGWLTMEREYFCNSCQTETRHEAQQRKWWMFVFGKPNARTVNGVLPWTVVLVLAACTAGIGAVVVLFLFGPLLQVLSAVAGEKLSPTPRRCSICQTALDPLEMSRNTKGAAVSMFKKNQARSAIGIEGSSAISRWLCRPFSGSSTASFGYQHGTGRRNAGEA